jgi:chemotaxis protein methyltransferase CheR
MAGQLTQAESATMVIDELETVLLLQALEGRFGVDFLSFDVARLQSKLAAYVAESGADNISALQGRALRDEALGAELIRVINRSEASSLGEPFHLMALRCSLLPILRSSPWPAVWLADCTDLRVLEEEGLLARTRVFVTSGSEQALEAMRSHAFSDADVETLERLHGGSGGTGNIGDHLQANDGGFVVKPALRSLVSWHVHHLATDTSFREFHAIIATRPLGEYGDALRARALRVFNDSLCPFGVLQVDDAYKKDIAHIAKELEPVLGQFGVYRRAS